MRGLVLKHIARYRQRCCLGVINTKVTKQQSNKVFKKLFNRPNLKIYKEGLTVSKNQFFLYKNFGLKFNTFTKLQQVVH